MPLGKIHVVRKSVRQLAAVSVASLASMVVGTIVTPAVSSADCAYGEYWDPLGNVCRSVGVQLPKNCGDGWWDPLINDCRPPFVPLGCDQGAWWDPAANVCRPPLLPPS
jgi:hypothetical protein